MNQRDRILYQFPISHFCEKTRWSLDAKGLSYRVRDLLPGLHRLTVGRLERGLSTVPVLDDGGTRIGDSAEITLHLERAYPDRPLLPAADAARARALELEEYFGKTAGRFARQLVYSHLIAERPGGAAAVFFEPYSPSIRLFGKVMAPLMERTLKKAYKAGPQSIDKATACILEVIERLERETSGDPGRYLVGDKLSIADISAASLLGPVIGPPQSPWSQGGSANTLPKGLLELRASLQSRPGGAWVLARYARER